MTDCLTGVIVVVAFLVVAVVLLANSKPTHL
jgi:preprotein translocase subunit SecG